MTALPTFQQRFVIPPMHREEAIEAFKDPRVHKRAVACALRCAEEEAVTMAASFRNPQAFAPLLRYPSERFPQQVESALFCCALTNHERAATLNNSRTL